MKEYGKQYKLDNKSDHSGFRSKARLHQSKFRTEKLKVLCDTYGNYLTKEDAENGLNFFDGHNIFDAVKKYRKFNKNLYSNMLRSEHIPFNLFVPFNEDETSNQFLKNVLNQFMGETILSIDRIEIEYAPKKKADYLNDSTSFDTYIEYTDIKNDKGMIGIEVKYTELSYTMKKDSAQANKINDQSSTYFKISAQSDLYNANAEKHLITDKFRQVWRNHLLGESILIKDEKYKHFTSITLFPDGNQHFHSISKEYLDLLKDKKKFIPITFEEFLTACTKFQPNAKYDKWITYLKDRYLVIND